jgi:hypothetical protein
MKAAASVLGLVIVLAIGYWVYKAELAPGPQGGTPPIEQADIAGVTSDLVSIGQAERLYLASHGSYASLEQLQQEGSIPFSGSRHGYNYRVEVHGVEHFKAVADPAGPAKPGWPTLSLDETLQVSRE